MRCATCVVNSCRTFVISDGMVSTEGEVKGTSSEGPPAPTSEGRAGTDLRGSSGLGPRQPQKPPGSLSISSVEARPSRRECCGLIGEDSVGRSGTDETLYRRQN